MPSSTLRFPALCLTALAGCASAPPPAAPNVPAALRVPADQSLYLEAFASGFQVYECASKGAAYEWSFKAPEATLADRAGRALGRHYAGPTWQAADGSTVVGEVKARDPGPTPTAIPWLLLSAKANTGSGTLSSARSIQRVATVGGIAPNVACAAKNAGQVARVPYTATYYFYR
jgi:FtsP/CotA-like multicopper oxidase with cupredoxin domain